jgi:choline dehydrogenase-like flavoprotein
MAYFGLRALTFEINSVTVTEDCTDVAITSAAKANSGQVTFGSGATGREYTLSGNFLQSNRSGGLDELIWDHAGESMAVTVKPAGGTTVSASTPSYTGTVIISEPDGALVGGGASETDYFVSPFSFVFTAKPTKHVS